MNINSTSRYTRLLLICVFLPFTALGDETQGTYQGKFVGLERLRASTSDGPITTFVIQLDNGKRQDVCLLGLTKEEKQVRKDPKSFAGRKCIAEWAMAEAQLLGGDVIDLIALSSLSWIDEGSDNTNLQSKPVVPDGGLFPFTNMTMYFESAGADNAFYFENSATGSAPYLAESFRGGGIVRGVCQYKASKKGNNNWEIQLAEGGDGRMTINVGPLAKKSGGGLKASGVINQDGGSRQVDLVFAPGNRLDSASPPPHLR
jgi:hypothetical protein